MRRGLPKAISGALVTAVVLTGCGASEDIAYTPRDDASAPTVEVDRSVEAVLEPDLSGIGAGSLVEAVELTGVATQIRDTGARGMRVVYRSTSGLSNTETTVSGSVFVPAGVPPDGGWPVIAYGHGQTGVRNECGPSLHADLLGYAEQVASLILNGFVVAMPDYEGLGSFGTFPMSDARTLGANMIDAVRAAARVTPDVSPRWASFGASIGGTASWAANEMSASYAPELESVGAVSLVPTADMSQLPVAAAAGELSTAQRYQYVLEVISVKLTSHPEMVVEEYLSGETFRNLDLLTACIGADAERAAELISTLPASDTVPASPEAVDRLRGWLAEGALPKSRASAPMLLIYATEEATVRPEWTADAVQRSCDLGSRIEVIVRTGQTDAAMDTSPALPWLRDALEGTPSTADSCS